MFNQLSQYNRIKQYTYIVTVAPTSLPLTIEEVEAHLKLNSGEESTDYLNGLIATARDFFEKYTTRILINTTFKTFRDAWFYATELRKSKFQSIVNFKYYVDDTLIVVDSDLYYLTTDNLYSALVLKNNECWPNDIDCRIQSIQIEFVAGFGPTSSSIPDAIKTGLLNHIAYLYENRGDCDITNITKAIPNTTKLIYDMWKIGRDGAVY